MMDETMRPEGHPEGCQCKMCRKGMGGMGMGMMGGCGCGRNVMWGGGCGHNHWWHILARVLVLLLVFWLGIVYGEVRSLLDNPMQGGYSSYHHSRMMDGGGYGMMGGNQ